MGTLPLPTRQGAPAVQDPVASSINPASDAALAGLPGGVPAATHVCTAWSRAPGPRKVQQGAAAEAPVLTVHSPAPALAHGLAVPRLHARPRPQRQRRAAPGLPAPGEERGGRTDSWAGRRRGDVWRGSIPEHRGARCAQPEMGGRWGAGDCSRGRGRAPPWASPPVQVASRRPPAALPRRARLPLAQDSPPPPRPVRPSGGGVFNSAAFCSPKWPSRNLRPPNLKPRKIDGFSFFTKGLPVVTAQRPRGKRSPRHRRQRGQVRCRRSRDGGNAWQCRGSTRHCETPHGPRSRRPRRVLRALYSHVIGGSGGRTPAAGPRAGSCGRAPSGVRALRDRRPGGGVPERPQLGRSPGRGGGRVSLSSMFLSALLIFPQRVRVAVLLSLLLF